MRILRALVLLVVLAVALPRGAQAQFENYTWYFGDGQGLDFSTSPPTFLRDGALSCFEGSASISDGATGKLLFYTDGIMVINRDHRMMPNGNDLASDPSSTQPAVIIPFPGSNSKYYIFTADQSGYRGAPRGIHYSIVDMTKDNGFGDVIVKNVPLLGPASEKITAVKICGGSAYWIIAHAFYGSKFYAWRVDVGGVSLPVVSEVGSYHGPAGGDGVGWMSASPDGTMLALAFYERSANSIELFKFDAGTGEVSNSILLPGGVQPYGITFSPQGKKVYATSVGRIDQYDVQVFNAVAIQNSWQPLFSATHENGGIKIGPDGKLYIQHGEYLGTISAPELTGALCQYNERAIYASPGSKYGLPNNVDATAEGTCVPPVAGIKMFDTSICKAECVSFLDSSRGGATKWSWEFEGANPSSSAQKDPTNICYPQPGTYTIRLTASNSSGSSVAAATIVVGACLPPVVSLKDTMICKGKCITFVDTSTQAYTRTWTFAGGTPGSFLGKTPPAVCFDYPGEYDVMLIAKNEYGEDTAISHVTVDECPWPIARSEHDTVICAGSSVSFSDRSANTPTSWDWQFSGGTPGSSTDAEPQSIVYDTPGYYQIRQIATNANGSDTAFTQIHVKECKPPRASLADQIVCQHECIELKDASTFEPTAWQWKITGPVSSEFTVQHPGRLCFDLAGTYHVELIVTNAYGADTAQSTIVVNSAAGWNTASLQLERSIPLCSSLDTFITLYAGCSTIDYSNIISTDVSVKVGQLSGSIAPFDSIRIPIRIQPIVLGTPSASVSLLLDAKNILIPVVFLATPDAENFTYGDLDGVFSTVVCTPETHTLTLTNEACASQTIASVTIEPSNTGFAVLDVFPQSYATNESGEIRIQYNASVANSAQAELVIRTASGTERRYPLSGTRTEPVSGLLHIQATGPSTILPNQATAAQVNFGDEVDAQLAPEMIEMIFQYNTDLISTANVQPQDGWSLIDMNEGSGELRIRLVREKRSIHAGAPLLDLEFKSFVAAESSTSLRLASIRCNPTDPDFERCVFNLASSDASEVTMLPVCGTPELQASLRSAPAFTIAVNPHPVIAGSDLKFGLRAFDLNLLNAPLQIELIDLAGRSSHLINSTLAAGSQDFLLPIPSITSGSYVLKVTIGGVTRTQTLVVQ